jgi:hypothetical protein
MRTLTSGITTALTTGGAFPGWLVEITLTTGSVLRYTSLDTGFTFNGFTWTSRDFDVVDLTWTGGVARTATLVLGDADQTMLAFVFNLAFADATVKLWQCYASASGEAEPVFSGKCGDARPDRAALTCTLALNNGSDTRSIPNVRVQQVIAPGFLLVDGTHLSIAGQGWNIERPPGG